MFAVFESRIGGAFYCAEFWNVCDRPPLVSGDAQKADSAAASVTGVSFTRLRILGQGRTR